MKLKTLSLAAFITSFSSATLSATFYEDINFGGSQVSAFAPTVNNNLGNFNDKVSSVRVGSGECVLLAEHENLGGGTLILGPGNHATIPSSFNDQTTGWSVFTPNPGYSCQESVGVFYQNANRTGWTYPAPHGINNNDLWTFNDHASSVVVPSGLCILAYSNTNFGGHKDVLLPGDQFLERNDDMTSYRVLSETHPECN